ncbi:hypothetical protein XA68_13928 [Ophiocordyceps unilateralis]|uniref:Uncharacterized protein n=1 Tax=Ophiocordyceps unilateralis TaxID=268505 RepID=A0A2A9PBA7_OPHUN|nr:hypothetical protein XA68_13928 [Ophiocordyceps unilateralis]
MKTSFASALLFAVMVGNCLAMPAPPPKQALTEVCYAKKDKEPCISSHNEETCEPRLRTVFCIKTREDDLVSLIKKAEDKQPGGELN